MIMRAVRNGLLSTLTLVLVIAWAGPSRVAEAAPGDIGTPIRDLLANLKPARGAMSLACMSADGKRRAEMAKLLWFKDGKPWALSVTYAGHHTPAMVSIQTKEKESTVYVDGDGKGLVTKVVPPAQAKNICKILGYDTVDSR